MRPGTTPGKGTTTRARGRLAAVVIGLLAALAAPAAAFAQSTAVQVSAGKLRLDGIAGSPSAVEVRYKLASEMGEGVPSNRLLVTDEAGLVSLGPDCAALSPTQVSCDAVPVLQIVARLGDGDDVLVLNAGKGDGVPSSYATDLNGQKGADVIRGGVGDDVIRGEQGRDVLAGWSGDDLLLGGGGSDGLIGFGGDDTLRGEGGRDALFGQKGHDRMFGGPQNDVLLAKDGTRDPQLVCGPGKRQQASTDRFDPRPRGCLQPGQRKRAKAK